MIGTVALISWTCSGVNAISPGCIDDRRDVNREIQTREDAHGGFILIMMNMDGTECFRILMCDVNKPESEGQAIASVSGRLHCMQPRIDPEM